MTPHPANGASPWSVPDWRNLHLNEGVLAEPIPENNRIALWLPGTCHEGFRHWERVSNVLHTEFAVERGVCAVAATSVQARQRVRGFVGRLLQRFRGTEGERSWVLPNGKPAEQWGERQTDLMLVWAEDKAKALDETWIQSRWPESKRCQKIGENLFLVAGVEPPGAGNETELMRSQEEPRQLAEQRLAAARQRNDRRREATALADLGAIHLHEGDAQRALTHLEEALAMVRSLSDGSVEGDILGNLGLAALVIGQPQRARELFEQELAYARKAGDRFAEKTALERLGLAHAKRNDIPQALASLQQALTLARVVGHRKHEADLLWSLGVQYAELGQRDQAIAHAQAAVELLEELRNPQAAWFADHLRRYRINETGAWLSGSDEVGTTESSSTLLGGSIIAGLWATSPGPPRAPEAVHGPGLLRMAVSAAKSMAKFLGSGLKTVSSQVLQQRLRTCAACEHHTGLRCRLCGCFTNAKARMAHEECPIRKWPTQS